MLLHLEGGKLSGWVRPHLTGDESADEVIVALWLSLSLFNPELIVADINDASPIAKRFLNMTKGCGLKSVSRLKGISLTGQVMAFSADMSDKGHLIPLMTALCASAAKPSCISIEDPDEQSKNLFVLSCNMAEAVGADYMKMVDRLMIKRLSGKKLPGGIVNAGADWRVVCGAVLLSFLCASPLTVSAGQLMDEISPGFWNSFVNLGGSIQWK